MEIKNIVITGVAYKQVYDEVRSDLVISCPEVMVKDFKVSYAPVNYHKSDIRPRKSDIIGTSFRSGGDKLNVLATRYVSEIKEMWLETGQDDPKYIVMHCINSEEGKDVANDDKLHLILNHLKPQEPRAILIAIAGDEEIARQVSNYIDITANQEYGKYSGLMSKIFRNENELFRTTYNEIIARSLSGSEEVKSAPGVYALIDEILNLEGMTCVKLSNANIRQRPREIVRSTAKEARFNSIGDQYVNAGYNDVWRSYTGEMNRWKQTGQDCGVQQQIEKPVSEVVKLALDKWKQKNSFDYYYSDSSSDSNQSAQRDSGDSGYVSYASYSKSIRNVSDTDSAATTF